MRGLLTIPLAVLLAAAIGMIGCRLAGLQVSALTVGIAGLACVVAGELGLLPSLFARGASQGTIAQAGLVGTIVHLFAAAVVAALVFLGHLNVGNSFIYWLLGFYWITLLVLAIEIARSVRLAHSNVAQP